jgi:asparagine synthase (glutamine-hydrolysing)
VSKLVTAWRLLRLLMTRPGVFRRVIGVVRAHRTYLEFAALTDLADAAAQVESCAIPGALIEAGCALGGSAIVLAAAKQPARALRVYDTFERIPPPGAHDDADVHARYREIDAGHARGIAGETYYGYREALLSDVADAFNAQGLPLERNHVALVKGLFEDTLTPDGPVALAHIDCDWYDSVTTCLERIVPVLSPGGRLVIDDYDAWSGCRKAVDAFFADKRGDFRFERHARLHIVRAR